MTTPEDFMKRALELAVDNVVMARGGPFGCVVVKDGKIIGEGANSVTRTNDPTAHGEVLAIRQACQNLNSFTLAHCQLYTSCEPCPMCLAAIHWARIDQVFYAASQDQAAQAGFDDAFLYREFSLPPEKRKLKPKKLLADQALKPFQSWEASDQKIPY